ncbi:MAG: hypothetical protein AAFY03_03445 [Pseudomonadota bacterium]
MATAFRAFLSAVRRRHLDVSFASGGGLETRVVAQPGQWMASEDLERLSSDLRVVASKTLPEGGLTYGVFSGDPDRMRQSVITLVRDRKSGRPVAFNALAIIETHLNGQPVDVLHLGLVMVDPGARSQGLSWILYGLTCLLLWLRNGLRPLWISNVTQVPAVVGMVSETFSGVSPQPGEDGARDFAKVLLRRAIMADHRHVFGVGADAGFDEASGVITNAYTGGSDDLKKTFEEAPKHRNETYNQFCADCLDYDRGDDVLQIGSMDLAAARRYVLRQVPKGSLGSLLALTFLIALRRVGLPLIQWFSPGRPYGILRAR